MSEAKGGIQTATQISEAGPSLGKEVTGYGEVDSDLRRIARGCCRCDSGRRRFRLGLISLLPPGLDPIDADRRNTG